MGFLRHTLRTASVVGGIVVLVLASAGLFWAIDPYLFGLGLSAVLLWAWERFVRALLNPEAIRQGKDKGASRRWSIVAFSLIKYPLVALLLYMAVRHWRGDSRHALAFLGGFLTIHIVIGLRAVGRAVRDSDRPV